jgi:excinuclease ABC subunit A
MGPEGGSGGGTVLATGTPEHVATVPESHTGVFLREIFDAQDARVGKQQAVGARQATQKQQGGTQQGGKQSGTTKQTSKQKAGAR